jgi:choline dehydrogenase-like flavoprotein
MHTTSVASRNYSMSKTAHGAFNKAGFIDNPDFDNGNPLVLGPWIENWYNKSGRPAGKAYNLSGVYLMTDPTVRRIILRDEGNGENLATGIELVDSRHFTALKEIIISCGAHKTPQILMLSGIGYAEQLEKLEMEQVVDSPKVGRNLFDHLVLFQAYKFRHPEPALATRHAAGTRNHSGPPHHHTTCH